MTAEYILLFCAVFGMFMQVFAGANVAGILHDEGYRWWALFAAAVAAVAVAFSMHHIFWLLERLP